MISEPREVEEKDLDEQQLAVIAAVTRPSDDPDAVLIAVLTGGPGTGKSTLSRYVMEGWARLYGRDRILALSPTGKAARRFTEATKGWDAFTVHKALWQWDLAAAGGPSGSLPPPEELDAVIVDESSMVDTFLAARLLDALPASTRVLFVGDADQLPSVGPGAFFRDLIESGLVPTFRITEVYRQSRHSWIGENAARIKNGVRPVHQEASIDYKEILHDEHDHLVEAVKGIVLEHPEAQVLVPTWKTKIGATRLNEIVRDTVNPAKGRSPWVAGSIGFLEGDRVIHKKNNYELGVMNGEVGTVVGTQKVDREEVLIVDYGAGRVLYPRDVAMAQLKLAFALTVHSSQGSEYDKVILVVHSSHTFLLSRQIFYTGLTRAKKMVWVVGNEAGIHTAVTNKMVRERKTFLVRRLREAVSEGA